MCRRNLVAVGVTQRLMRLSADGGVIAPSEYGEPQNAAPAPVAAVRSAARLPAPTPASDYRMDDAATSTSPAVKVMPAEYGEPQDVSV